MALPPPSYETTMNSPGAPPPPSAMYPPPPAAGYPASSPGTAYPPPPPGSYPQQPPGAVYPPPPPPGSYQALPGAVGPQHVNQKGVPLPQAGGGPTVICVQPTIQSFRPVATMCPFCQQQVMTRVEYENGGLTWLAVGGIALMGCWLGCCLIPLCIDDCKDAIHICPNCNKIVAQKQRL